MSERTTNLLKDLVITRIFNARRELVWKAWTDPQLVTRWWGPNGFTSPACKIDFRVGGRYFYCMRMADGSWEGWSGGEFTQIIYPEKIVSQLFYADENGKVESPPDANDVEVFDVVTFEQLDNGKTRLTLHRSYWDEGEDEGLRESIEKMATVVAELESAS